MQKALQLVNFWKKKLSAASLLFICILGLLLQGQTPPPYTSYLPIVMNNLGEKTYSVSIYVQNHAASYMYDLGCAQGKTVAQMAGKQDHLVILAFGKMWLNNQTWEYGIRSFSDPTNAYARRFITFPELLESGKNFINGYWACSGSDRDSTLVLGLGTNNYGQLVLNSTFSQDELAAYYRNFGIHWARMVVALNDWIRQNGMGSQVMAAGAIDIEWDSITTGERWNTPYVTRAWTDGFDSADNDQAIYFNFGACVGCPNYSSVTWKYSTAMPWTQSDIYYVSWQAKPAYVVPEIYLTSGRNALQWFGISQFGVWHRGIRVDFSGPMTNLGACDQRDPNRTGECKYIDLAPLDAYDQLLAALNADAATSLESMKYITDIRWQFR